MNTKKYILFHKPYDVLSQFSPVEGRLTLADFGFPQKVYPVGRLDADSEGLLLLTDDNAVNHLLTDPRYDHPKKYLAQVERIPTDESLAQLRHGVVIEGKKTKPADVRLAEIDPNFPQRSTPVRFRKNVPTTWLELTLREGRNRQIRKMTASIGHPTLRLIRIGIIALTIDGLDQGKWKYITKAEIGL